MRRIVVVSGAPGVGKSAALGSMRQVLSEHVGEVAVLESDDFYMMIDPNWTLPPSRVDRWLALSGWLLRETALGFVDAGFEWVAIASNGLLSEAHVREFVRPFAERAAESYHVTLDPGDDVTLARIDARSCAKATKPGSGRDEGLRLLYEIRNACGPWTHVIDNGAMTAAETAIAIHDAVAAGSGRL